MDGYGLLRWVKGCTNLQRLYNLDWQIGAEVLCFIKPCHALLLYSPLLWACTNLKHQARKGFWPPSAMKGIGYFQNLRNFLDISGNFLGGFFLGGFFGEDFLGGFFGRIFWEDFLGGILWKE